MVVQYNNVGLHENVVYGASPTLSIYIFKKGTSFVRYFVCSFVTIASVRFGQLLRTNSAL